MNTKAQVINDHLLPLPVRKYFELVFPDHVKTIKSVQLTHSGNFRTSPKSKWVKIRGIQYFRSDVPEFEWTGKTTLFTATDRYVDGKGSLKVKLLGLIPIIDEVGSHVDQGELLRWLAESIWFPTNFLPRENQEWLPIDDLHAKLIFNYNGMELFYDVTFNETGEITRLETLRYKEKGKLEKWAGTASSYIDIDGYLIPKHIRAYWESEEGSFQYVDFYVDSIKFQYQ